MPPPLIAQASPFTRRVTPEQATSVIAQACPADAYRGQRVLLIVPDGTRTARPVAPGDTPI